jgi:predicted methyltransferase
MNSRLLAAASAALFAAGAGLAAMAATATPPAWVTNAVNDATRPQADKDRDAERKPADMLTFAGVRPGQTVVDFMPGGGYFTRLFSDAVGPHGTVYAFVPSELAKLGHGPMPENGAHTDPARPNITAVVAPVNAFAVPTPADIVWTAQNYHDLHDPFMGPADMKLFDEAVFKALKHGGVFVIVDHAAPSGSGVSDTNTLHRIDEAVVKQEVESVGFVLVAEDNSLRNPADTRTLRVFDPAIRGHTDQFVLKFRKP